NDAAVDGAREGVKRLGECHARLHAAAGTGRGDGPLVALARTLEHDVAAALDDDLSAPRALAALFEFVRVANRELDHAASGAGGGGAAARGARGGGRAGRGGLPSPPAAGPAPRGGGGCRRAARGRAREA